MQKQLAFPSGTYQPGVAYKLTVYATSAAGEGPASAPLTYTPRCVPLLKLCTAQSHFVCGRISKMPHANVPWVHPAWRCVDDTDLAPSCWAVLLR